MASTVMFSPYDPARAMPRRIVASTGNAYQIDPRGSAQVDVSDVAWFQTQGFSATPTAAGGQSLMYAPYMADQEMARPITNPNTGNTYFINAAGCVAVATADIAWFQTQGYALVPTVGTGTLMSTQVEVGQALAGPLFSPITGNMYVMNGQGWIVAATADVAWLQGQGFAPVASGGVAPPIFPPVVGATQATIAADFAGQQYWAAGASKASFAAWLTAIGGTYTRASTATYLQGGVVKTATANTPRFPTDLGGAPQGIRLTGPATNVLLSSTDLTNAAVWVFGSGVTVVTGASDPAGGNNAQTITATTTAAWGTTNYVFSTGAIVQGQPCMSSIWVRRRTGSGPVSLANANISAQNNIPVTSTWQRFSVFTPATGAVSAAFEIDILTAGDQIDVWNAQETQTVFLCDDIPTTTAAVTQAADNLSFPFTQTTFSALVGTNILLNDGSGQQRVVGLTGGYAVIFINNSTSFGTFGNAIFLTGPAITDVINPHKSMMVTNNTNAWLTSDGLVPVTAAGAFLSAAPSNLALGNAGGTYANGNYSQLAVWNGVVASTAEMQRLTS